MLKNVQRAEVRQGADPDRRIALASARSAAVAFDAFFTHILMHELMHGLGPHETVGAGGKSTTGRAPLQQSYGALEEAKADIAGLFALQYLIDKGVLDAALERTLYVTFLASSFRTLRFGAATRTPSAWPCSSTTLLDAGRGLVAKDGTLLRRAGEVQTRRRARSPAEIMNVQAAGDGAKAAELLRVRGAILLEVKAVLDPA